MGSLFSKELCSALGTEPADRGHGCSDANRGVPPKARLRLGVSVKSALPLTALATLTAKPLTMTG